MIQSDPLNKNNVKLLGRIDAEQTLMFVHGFGTDQRVWDTVIRPFLADYRIVLYDHIGAGDSSQEAYSPYRYESLDGYVDDLLNIHSALDNRDTVLCGHSMGALVGIKAVFNSPDAFSRLVLIGCSPCYINNADYFGGFEQADLDVMYSKWKPITLPGQVDLHLWQCRMKTALNWLNSSRRP